MISKKLLTNKINTLKNNFFFVMLFTAFVTWLIIWSMCNIENFQWPSWWNNFILYEVFPVLVIFFSLHTILNGKEIRERVKEKKKAALAIHFISIPPILAAITSSYICLAPILLTKYFATESYSENLYPDYVYISRAGRNRKSYIYVNYAIKGYSNLVIKAPVSCCNAKSADDRMAYIRSQKINIKGTKWFFGHYVSQYSLA